MEREITFNKYTRGGTESIISNNLSVLLKSNLEMKILINENGKYSPKDIVNTNVYVVQNKDQLKEILSWIE